MNHHHYLQIDLQDIFHLTFLNLIDKTFHIYQDPLFKIFIIYFFEKKLKNYLIYFFEKKIKKLFNLPSFDV